MLRSDPLADAERLIKRVYAYVAYRIGDGADAEDVTSETFERAVRYKSSYDRSKGEPISWLLGIARRCIEVVGHLPALVRPLVAEARPPSGMASGDLPWSLAQPLAQRLAGVSAMEVANAADAAEVANAAHGRGLVVVVRDPLRHPWQTALLAAASDHPAAVVVDVGWPSELSEGLPAVRTRGIAPALLNAAADLLTRA